MKPFLSIFASVVCAMMVISCHHQGTPKANRDKDEEHDLVVAQELSNSRVQCMAEDAAGQLWIGTFRGLNRYDCPTTRYRVCCVIRKDACGWPLSMVCAGIPSMTTLKMYLCRRVTATSGNC